MKIPAATPVPEGLVQQPTPLYFTSRPTAVPEGPVQQTTLSLPFGATGVPGGPVQQTTLSLP